MKLANFFGQGVEHSQELCEKKILRRFFRTIFLESFKVKIESVTVNWIFLYLNTIRFQCLAAHSKAKIEFYDTEKKRKKMRRLGT